MGQYASIIGIIRDESKAKFPTDKLSSQICQHIIGMRPEILGTPANHEKTRLELLDETEFKEEKEHDDLNDFADVQVCTFISAFYSLFRALNLTRMRLNCCVSRLCSVLPCKILLSFDLFIC
jgi:hypothetical protein